VGGGFELTGVASATLHYPAVATCPLRLERASCWKCSLMSLGSMSVPLTNRPPLSIQARYQGVPALWVIAESWTAEYRLYTSQTRSTIEREPTSLLKRASSAPRL